MRASVFINSCEIVSLDLLKAFQVRHYEVLAVLHDSLHISLLAVVKRRCKMRCTNVIELEVCALKDVFDKLFVPLARVGISHALEILHGVP